MCVCVCARLDVIGLSGSTLHPQTGWSLCCVWCHNLSDVLLSTETFGQEITWSCLCMWVHKLMLAYSHHMHLTQTALSWVKVVSGCRRVREGCWEGINNARGVVWVCVCPAWLPQMSHWSRCRCSQLRHWADPKGKRKKMLKLTEELDFCKNNTFWMGR